MQMNQSFSIDELVENLGRTVRSAVELVAKTSPLDIKTVESAVETGLDRIKDRLADDFELVRKTEYGANVELLELLKKQVDLLEERIEDLEKRRKVWAFGPTPANLQNTGHKKGLREEAFPVFLVLRVQRESTRIMNSI